jgi:hypothetical protein
MSSAKSVFQSNWYHGIIASIYIVAGILLVGKGIVSENSIQAIAIGGIIFTYGCYRLIFKLVFKSNKTPEV